MQKVQTFTSCHWQHLTMKKIRRMFHKISQKSDLIQSSFKCANVNEWLNESSKIFGHLLWLIWFKWFQNEKVNEINLCFLVLLVINYYIYNKLGGKTFRILSFKMSLHRWDISMLIFSSNSFMFKKFIKSNSFHKLFFYIIYNLNNIWKTKYFFCSF